MQKGEKSRHIKNYAFDGPAYPIDRVFKFGRLQIAYLVHLYTVDSLIVSDILVSQSGGSISCFVIHVVFGQSQAHSSNIKLMEDKPRA